MDVFERTRALLGEAAMQKLARSRAVVFGLGGVGSYVAEGLARSGVGSLTLVDGDRVSPSNCNRQLVADTRTVGRLKAEVAAERARAVNPAVEAIADARFIRPENADGWDFSRYDFAVDAVDDVRAKTEIVARAKAAGVPVISCMGTGNKLDPSRLRVADIAETHTCPLARIMRKEWKDRGLGRVCVVFSEEPPLPPKSELSDGKRTVGSVAFVPSVAGMMIAGEVVRRLTEEKER